MAVPDPPFSTPRIMKVLEPSAGQYEVIVRMDPTMASKFPDKPFGTAISAIGLAVKDSDKYPGYTLVSIEPADKGAKDHYWIFQKLGGPEWTTTSNSKESLTPQKYRGQTVVVKTEQEVAPDTIPTTLAGNLVSSVVTQTPNTGKAVLTDITETITENVIPLAGEEYGDIVTKSVSEVLVVDGTPADSGMDITESVVDPIGNGKSVKRTKRVKGGTWPDPLNREVSKQGPGLPPERYRKDVTVTKISKKIATSAIPTAPTLTGDEVGKSYVKETPDRAEETTTTQTLTLNTSSVDESVERKPFVSITSTMTPGSAPVIPGIGNGSARLVYENGATKIYENVAEVATARPGPAGTEKDEKPFVRISTPKRYSTDNNIATATGIANIVFNDGVVQVYEISEPTATPKPYTLLAGKDAKLGYRIEETDVYATDTTLATKTGNVGVAYDDGNVRVYKKTEVRAFLNNTEFDSEVKNTKLFKETTHSKFQITATGDDTKDWGGTMVYSDGDLTVFRIDEVSITTKTAITYYSVVNAQVPSVLSSILIEPIEMLPNSNGAVRDKVCVRAIIEEGYSGLFKAKITEEYTENPSEADSFTPLIFKPTAIHYDGLNYGVSIGETLHGSITLVDSIGSEDPDYAPLQELSSDFRTFNATVPAVVPTGWQSHAIQVEPYKNGYLVKKIYIQYKP